MHDVHQLAHQVHLQRAADAAVLQRHQVALVGAAHYTALLYERGVDVNLAQVVDDYGKAYAAAVVEDTVEQSGLAAAEIAGQEQYGSVFHFV